MSLTVKRLSYSLQHKSILTGVDLTIEAKTITTILGSNGSGKSTLLKLLAGLLDPDGGEILFNNEPVPGPSQKLVAGHREIILVRQDNRLFPFHTVKQNLKHVLQSEIAEVQEEKIEELSKLLNLTANLNRQLNKLSGGEQQRVAIAAALAHNPQFLLMDEPFSHIDLNLKHQMKKHLVEVVEHFGTGILFVTHDPLDALSLADKIAILEDGVIIEEGSASQLYSHPKKRTTAQLTGYCNWIPVKKLPGKPDFPIINNQYLVRPENIKLDEIETPASWKANIEEKEFCGFYYQLYLFVEELQLSLLTVVDSFFFNKITNDKVYISFR